MLAADRRIDPPLLACSERVGQPEKGRGHRAGQDGDRVTKADAARVDLLADEDCMRRQRDPLRKWQEAAWRISQVCA
jgi:hypothetical protein